MKKRFKKSFIKDVSGINQSKIKKKAVNFILKVGLASNIEDLLDTIKMKGTTNAYRTTLDGYEIGFFYNKRTNDVVFVRIVERKDIHKLFVN